MTGSCARQAAAAYHTEMGFGNCAGPKEIWLAFQRAQKLHGDYRADAIFTYIKTTFLKQKSSPVTPSKLSTIAANDNLAEDVD